VTGEEHQTILPPMTICSDCLMVWIGGGRYEDSSSSEVRLEILDPAVWDSRGSCRGTNAETPKFLRHSHDQSWPTAYLIQLAWLDAVANGETNGETD
jgi:hypothetical protein